MLGKLVSCCDLDSVANDQEHRRIILSSEGGFWQFSLLFFSHRSSQQERLAARCAAVCVGQPQSASPQRNPNQIDQSPSPSPLLLLGSPGGAAQRPRRSTRSIDRLIAPPSSK